MKIIITAIALFLSSISFSQSLTGKWKPVYFSMDSLMRGDVKQDTVYMNPLIKENFKNDENPEASEQLMEMLFQALFKNMKETQEEYFDDGVYTETNTRTNKIKTGSYHFDQQNKILVKKMNKEQSFTVSWRNDQLVLTAELESHSGKKGKLEVIYEKFQ